MAFRVASVYASLEVDTRPLDYGLKNAGTELDKFANASSRKLGNAEKAFARFAESMGYTSAQIKAINKSMAQSEGFRRVEQSLAQLSRNGLVSSKVIREIADSLNIASLSSKAFANANANALGFRTESAIRDELRKVQTAYTDLRHSGVASARDIEIAWQKLVETQKRLESEIKTTPTIQRNADAFNTLGFRSQSSISAEIKQAGQAYQTLKTSGVATSREIAAAQQHLIARTQQLTQEYKNLGVAQSKSKLVNTEQFSKSASAIDQLKVALMGFISIYTLQDIAKTSIQIDSIEKSFYAVTGTMEGARGEMKYIRDEAQRLGLDFFALAESFKGFMAAGKTANMPAEQIKEIFTAVTEASTVMGLAPERTKLALYALEQMISKGAVSMEELRRQLGDQLPGAFQLGAKAMGLTTQEFAKLVETGRLASVEFLPKFAEEVRKTFGPGLVEAMKTPRAEFQRFMNDITLAKDVIGRGGFLVGIAESSKALSEAFNTDAFQKNLQDIGYVLGTLTGRVGEIFAIILKFGPELTYLVGVLGAAKVASIALTPAIMGLGKAFLSLRAGALFSSVGSTASLIGFGATALINPITAAITALAAAAAAITYLATRQTSGEKVMASYAEQIGLMTSSAEGAEHVLGQLTERTKSLSDAQLSLAEINIGSNLRAMTKELENLYAAQKGQGLGGVVVSTPEDTGLKELINNFTELSKNNPEKAFKNAENAILNYGQAAEWSTEKIEGMIKTIASYAIVQQEANNISSELITRDEIERIANYNIKLTELTKKYSGILAFSEMSSENKVQAAFSAISKERDKILEVSKGLTSLSDSFQNFQESIRINELSLLEQELQKTGVKLFEVSIEAEDAEKKFMKLGDALDRVSELSDMSLELTLSSEEFSAHKITKEIEDYRVAIAGLVYESKFAEAELAERNLAMIEATARAIGADSLKNALSLREEISERIKKIEMGELEYEEYIANEKYKLELKGIEALRDASIARQEILYERLRGRREIAAEELQIAMDEAAAMGAEVEEINILLEKMRQHPPKIGLDFGKSGGRSSIKDEAKDAADALLAVYQIADPAKAQLMEVEKEFSEFKENLKASGLSPEEQARLLPVGKKAIEDMKDSLKEADQILQDFEREYQSAFKNEETASSIISQMNTFRDAAREAFESGRYSAEQYAEILERIDRLQSDKLLQNSKEFFAGIERGWQDYIDEAKDAASQTADFTNTIFSGMEDALISFVSNGKFSFKDFANSVISDLARIAAKAAMSSIFGSIGGMLFGGNFLGSGSGGMGYAVGNLGGFGSGNLPFALASGGVMSGPGISTYSNSIVSKPTIFPFAHGIGLMGEAGSEAIMPLTRVGGDLGVRAEVFGGKDVVNNIVVNAPPGSQVETQEERNPMGGIDTTIFIDMIDKAMAAGISSGRSKTANAIKARRM